MKVFSAICIIVYSIFGFFPTSRVYASDIFLNEFIVNASTGNPEWVEIYNASESADYLKNYYLDDDTSFDSDTGSSAKKLLSSLDISNPRYPFFQFTQSIFNNDGDSVVLFDPNGNIIDQFTYYEDPGSDVSIGRYPDQTGNFYRLSISTKGQSNSLPIPSPTPTPPPPTNTPNPTSTSAPTSTQSPSVTNTPIPTVTKSVTKAPTKPVTPTDKIAFPTYMEITPEDLLGAATEPAQQPDSGDNTKKSIIIALLVAALGLAMIAGILVWQKKDSIRNKQ